MNAAFQPFIAPPLLLYDGENSRIYRAELVETHAPVILKVLRSDTPTQRQRIQFYNEYDFTKDLTITGVRSACGQTIIERHDTLILHYVDGCTLKEWLTHTPRALSDLLRVAIRIAQILGEIHQHHLIHKDINSQNILIQPEQQNVTIIDFGIASKVSLKMPHLGHPDLLEGTLAYISPEQTGRMNRVVDERTDLYSLGVTLYEMFTAHLPFESDDPMELVHAHLAKTPTSPNQINPEIPDALGRILLKLLAKNAEDRYQSAFGLKWDLEQCLARLETSSVSAIDAEFQLAQRDISGKLHLPERLYGREQEIEILRQAFERIASASSNAAGHSGKAELLLVSGVAGVGKSALAHEMHSPVAAQQGYFIQGKFDQFQQDIPYSAFIQAFEQFVEALLTFPEAELRRWRDALLAAAGGIGKVLTELIPTLEFIIGKQPELPVSDSISVQNRFDYALRCFIGAIARADHPLVIFLDDWQWADWPSIKLLETLLMDKTLEHLLIIAAFRENEVVPTHPFLLAVEQIRQTGRGAQTLQIKNLTFADVCALLADALQNRAIANVQGLARLVYGKTQGNAFFTRQFLIALYEDGLLTLDSEQMAWRWDIEQIRERAISDNVVALLTQKVQKFSAATQRALSFAACIGNQFPLSTLAIIAEREAAAVNQLLEPAILEGLLLPNHLHFHRADPTTLLYRFAHDRIQQAAYTLVPDAEKQAAHLRIGRLLLSNIQKHQFSADSAEMARSPELDERLFEIVNHWNLGRHLIETAAENIVLARLNLWAGQKAKASAAHESALHYLSIGIENLPEDAWERWYPLTFALYREQYECAYVSGNFEQAEQLFSMILTHAHSTIDAAAIYNIRLINYVGVAKEHESFDIGQKALRLFGMSLPEGDLNAEIVRELEAIQMRLRNKAIADLVHLPLVTHPECREAIRIFMNLLTPAFISNPLLFKFLIAKVVHISLEEGLTPEMPQVFAGYASLLEEMFDDYHTAAEFGRLAIRLSERFDNPSQKCRTYHTVAIFIKPWIKPLHSSTALARQGFQYGMESGEFAYAVYCLTVVALMRLTQGTELNSVLQVFIEMDNISQKARYYGIVENILATRQLVICLQGHTANPGTFNDEHFCEETFLEQMKMSPVARCEFYTYKLQAFYLYERYEDAWRMALHAEPLLPSMAGIVAEAEYNLYASLTLCALYLAADSLEQQQYRERLRVNQQRMQRWAENCAENFRHKYLLIEAEIARIEGRDWEAVANYRQAIAEARQQKFLQNEAIGNELFAKFWLAHGDERLASACLADAYDGYRRWGADGKVADLKARYPHLLIRMSFAQRPSGQETSQTDTSSNSTTGAMLDVATVLKASQTLSSEIVLPELLKKMMRLVMENAGAQKAALLLEQNGVWLVEAESRMDNEEIATLQARPLDERDGHAAPAFAQAIITYVMRTQTPVVLHDAANEGVFIHDPYIIAQRPKSILCLPLIKQGRLAGMLYLENNLATGVFTPVRLELLNALSAQMMISIENALLYATLENKVKERTRDLETEKEKLQISEQHAQELKEAAETANRAKSTFLAHISHELRTPLNGILGYTQLLRNDIGLAGKQRDAVAAIHRNGEHLLLLINDLLDLSKIESQKMELFLQTFPLPLFLQNLVETNADRAAQKGLRVYAELSPDLPPFVHADERRLRQILLNLFSNAIKFTHHGSIVLRVYPIEESNQSSSPRIHFEIQDTGIGIATEHLSQVFMAFFQVNHQSAYEGSGLGLTISQQLARLMGSELRVNSTVGKGSVFWFEVRLAAAANAYANIAPPQRHILGVRGEQRKILIVDDHAGNRQFLQALLLPLGFDVREASNGQEAIEIVRTWQPDAILMDLVMPVMDGFEATRHIRTLKTHPVVIGISASVLTPARQNSFAAGCDDFLPKPVSFIELLDCLQRHLALEWVYANTDADDLETKDVRPPKTIVSPTTTPSQDVLLNILRCAEGGDVTDLHDLLDDLKNASPELLAFVTKIESLANHFQFERIREFVRSLLPV
ncbi:ATP-binding region ATPase domain protein [Candidatus Moduliflexus flocculans]|uniref:histidine kinase n=1 Tax=Candidatus Moduliflexus flocculans TaxID=1499966 RepID=A0A0S6VRL4_9BACT|nr:ATP-binding region ATPase domain protein [Candidatus Moduliflexus flocculans]